MNLQNKYSRDEFLSFISSFIPNFGKDIRKVDTRGLKTTTDAVYLGESPDLDLAVFELTHTSSSDARVTLATEGFKLMKDSSNFRALIAYVPEKSNDWRLSLMTATPDTTEKGKVILKLSNPRRYSFFLGESAKVNTPYQFLIKQEGVKDFDELQKRFSLEVVNRDFYKEISQAFTQLVNGQLKLPFVNDKSQTHLEFAVRLIGRIIFCWFLREKKSETGLPLMPKQILSLEAAKQNEDYYHSVLEPIFFEVLNKPIKSRRDDFTKEPYSSVPYLNGGLFSPQEDDYYKRTKGDLQSQFYNTLVIPNKWLIDFFETLETYNFTIDENTSYDEELSIDPEMLGRIFENLLAEINPETGESARKNTGSYYTPRTIVNYMVDESLVLYLNEKTLINEKKLRAIISYDLNDDNEHPLVEGEKEKILDALEELKLIDPACGSGAFPIGALQKIVFILQQIDSNGQMWFKKQLSKTSPELKRILEREFENKNFDYIRKLGIIRENIYGVDIQPIATEISRLRCFLTLIVDERIDDNLENRGIEPLPNLDFKFVTANSLIGLPSSRSVNQMGLFEDDAGIKELKELRDSFFNASGPERDQLKFQFVQTQNKMFQRMISEGRKGYADLTTKLSSWDPFSHKASSWFEPEWMFGIKHGFHIVIANPPYVDSETMVKDQNNMREAIKSMYSTASGNWDLYIPFLELGFNLMTESGVACFITPNKWYAIGYGRKIREKLVDGVYRVGNCNLINVFEAGNSPVITLYQKKRDDKTILVDKYGRNYQLDGVIGVKREYLDTNFGMLLSNYLPLVVKIRSQKNSVGDFYKIENPCTVSEAYELKNLLNEYSDSLDETSFFKFVNTGTIDSFDSLWGLKPTTYLKSKYEKPILLREAFRDKYPRRYAQMDQPKLIISGMRHFESFLDKNGEYLAGKSTEILLQKSDFGLKTCLALLNSKLIGFYIKEVYGVLGIDGGINFTTELIRELPFPETLKKDNDLEKLVDKLDNLKSKNQADHSQAGGLVNEINTIVYGLYGLSKEEIKIVEGVS